MIIRHDVEDQAYLELGEKYASPVVYLGGCAGTLIHPSWVLTAAHCVHGSEFTLLSVQHLGKNYRVHQVVIHPSFGTNNYKQYDIALIQLKEPIVQGRSVQLYSQRDEKGQAVIFVGRGGFGNGRDGLIRNDRKQRGATNTIVDTSDFLIEFLFDRPPDASELEGISGPGDSGGPAFIDIGSELYIAGVSSHQRGNGFEQATYGVSEFYARVSVHVTWIESNIKSASLPSLVQHPLIDAIKLGESVLAGSLIDEDVLKNEPVIKEAFYQTVILNRFDVAEELIAKGADINAATAGDVTLFDLVLVYGRTEYFDMLFDKFRQSNNIYHKNSAILPRMIDQYHDKPNLLDRVKVLLDQGANINAQYRDDDTAIILAGWLTTDIELISCLVDNGADIDIANVNGDTPVIDAAYLGKHQILEYLISKGANLNHRNNRGLSALDMARETKNNKAIDLLVSHSKGT